ncbi:MAG: flagellar basal body-associated FliL family protein [Gammaproteobacteria bacterium]|nr:flagellar basal body-associated FliL family protein [Gammaproteobacteria bacterium]MDH5777672.1 flagellar basal body-associated FliL family protein [Gammaproteobacteria bacterium]
MPPDELDLDEDGKKLSPKKLVILIISVLLLVAGSIGGTLYFSGALDEKKDEKEEDQQLKESQLSFYLPLDPEFIVNFGGEQSARYMQINISLMARQQYYIDQATKHMPRLRHEILLILSNQKYDDLKTEQGKSNLRQAILAKVQEIVISTDPKTPSIEAVFFTHFIMQ